MNIDFEAARRFEQSAECRDSYEEREKRRYRDENRRYAKSAERAGEPEAYRYIKDRQY